jgi:hypothetical protein
MGAAMTEQLSAERWGAALLDETLFRAASMLSAKTGPPSGREITVTLAVRVTARREPDELELQFDSLVDGTVTLVLEKPF